MLVLVGLEETLVWTWVQVDCLAQKKSMKCHEAVLHLKCNFCL